jgi:hypothetical protein
MSFLDVLDSIGTGQRAAASQAQPSSPRPLSRPLSKAITTNPSAAVSIRPISGPTATPNGTKRKINEAFQPGSEKQSQSYLKQRPNSGTPETNVSIKVSHPPVSAKPSLRAPTPAAKGHPRGSYAALMAEAKAAQKQRAKSEVGLIKHQATSKIRLSKSEKRKREDGEKAIRTKLGKQTQHTSKVEKRPRLDPKTRPESSYKGTAKPAQPISSYKGTAGLPSQHRPSSADSRHKSGKRSARYDEYLATDEEDDEDGPGVGDDDYGSETSSDMEADAFDMEEEETRALREAKSDDAKELALEKRLKREKEERRRKLEALARKRR